MSVLVAYVLLLTSTVCVSGQGSIVLPLRKKRWNADRHEHAERRRLLSKADAIPIHSYGERLRNAHGHGHEFSLTVTLAGKQEFDPVMDTGSAITYLPCFRLNNFEFCGYHEHQYYDWCVLNDF